MYAFCARVTGKKKNLKKMLQLLTTFACLQSAGSVCVYMVFHQDKTCLEKCCGLKKKKKKEEKETDARKPDLNHSLFSL